MKRLCLLIAVGSLWLAACAPAATPAPAQAPAAQPTQAPAAAAPQPTQAYIAPAPAAPAATSAPLATGLPNLRPPQSGGVLNPPTLVPTSTGNTSVTSGQTTFNTWRDPASGLAFQYPADWQAANDRNSRANFATIILTRTAATKNDTATILIDIRRKQGDLLTWLGQQLPIGSLRIDATALEGANSYKSYNARVSNTPAVFLYAPAHGQLAAVAALHTGDNQRFYQVTYLGSTPDNLDNRAAFLHVLNTLTLTGTTSSGVTLPTTAFINGVDPAKWK